MKVIFMNRLTFECANFTDVSNIAYNKTTNIYTITYGNNQTTSYSGNTYLISVLF